MVKEGVNLLKLLENKTQVTPTFFGKKLKEYKLGYQYINDQDVKFILQCINNIQKEETHQNLSTILYLNNNQITFQGCAHFELIFVNLKRIDLSGNMISDRGVKFLVRALNQSITEIMLGKLQKMKEITNFNQQGYSAKLIFCGARQQYNWKIRMQQFNQNKFLVEKTIFELHQNGRFLLYVITENENPKHKLLALYVLSEVDAGINTIASYDAFSEKYPHIYCDWHT